MISNSSHGRVHVYAYMKPNSRESIIHLSTVILLQYYSNRLDYTNKTTLKRKKKQLEASIIFFFYKQQYCSWPAIVL